MKKRNLMAIVVFVCTMLCFGIDKANAQSTTHVTFFATSGSDQAFVPQTTFYVTLIENSTNETYNFQTTSGNQIDSNTWDIGVIPAGNYTVITSYYNSSYTDSHFDWVANSQDGSNIHMYNDTDYTLTSSVTVSTDPFSGDYGLYISLYQY